MNIPPQDLRLQLLGIAEELEALLPSITAAANSVRKAEDPELAVELVAAIEQVYREVHRLYWNAWITCPAGQPLP